MINNKINVILAFISVLLFSSCVDNSHHLSGGYSFSSNGNLSILPYPTIFNKGIHRSITDYKFNEEFILLEQEPDLQHHIMMLGSFIGSRYAALKTLDSTSRELLPGQCEFYKQKLVEDSALYRKMNKLGVSSENTVKDMQICEYLADSIIKHDPYYQNIFSRKVNYWIIAHGELQKYFYLPSSEVYGPFSKQEYLQKRKEFGVPEELKLEFEE